MNQTTKAINGIFLLLLISSSYAISTKASTQIRKTELSTETPTGAQVAASAKTVGSLGWNFTKGFISIVAGDVKNFEKCIPKEWGVEVAGNDGDGHVSALDAKFKAAPPILQIIAKGVKAVVTVGCKVKDMYDFIEYIKKHPNPKLKDLFVQTSSTVFKTRLLGKAIKRTASASSTRSTSSTSSSRPGSATSISSTSSSSSRPGSADSTSSYHKAIANQDKYSPCDDACEDDDEAKSHGAAFVKTCTQCKKIVKGVSKKIREVVAKLYKKFEELGNALQKIAKESGMKAFFNNMYGCISTVMNTGKVVADLSGKLKFLVGGFLTAGAWDIGMFFVGLLCNWSKFKDMIDYFAEGFKEKNDKKKKWNSYGKAIGSFVYGVAFA